MRVQICTHIDILGEIFTQFKNSTILPSWGVETERCGDEEWGYKDRECSDEVLPAKMRSGDRETGSAVMKCYLPEDVCAPPRKAEALAHRTLETGSPGRATPGQRTAAPSSSVLCAAAAVQTEREKTNDRTVHTDISIYKRLLEKFDTMTWLTGFHSMLQII